MEAGKFEITPEAHVSEVFKPGAAFSLGAPIGDFDANAFEQAYAAAIVDRMQVHGYEQMQVEYDREGFSILAFNPDGSSIQVGYSVNDRLGLDVDYASGISVQNGNEINLDGQVWEFPEELGYDSLEEFLAYFKEW